MNEELIREIQSTRFQIVRFREGYEMSDVDRFLNELSAKVAQGVASPADIDAARFRPVRLREGYDMDWVDATLDNLRARLSTTPSAAAPPAAAPAVPPSAATPRQDAVPTRPPSVIQEVGSSGLGRLWGRLFGR